MKQRFLLLVSVAFLQAVLLTACSKGSSGTPDPDPPGPPNPPDPGTIAVSIPEPRENKINLAYFTDTKGTDIFSVSRAGSNTQATNTTATVKVEKKDDLVTNFNDNNGTEYEVLPDSLYTTAITGTANVYTINFASGDLSKKFSININGAKWDIAHDYAIAFIVSEATGSGSTTVSSFKDTVIAFLGVRNKWDGVYTATGTYADYVNTATTANYPYEWELRTTGANQCVVWDKVYLNKPGFLYNTGTGTSVSSYTNFGLLVNFDPATDKITSVTNYYGQPIANRSAALDATGVNAYTAATKTIDIKYNLIQTGLTPAPAGNIRASFNEKWTFSKAR